jgi:hypothetical protein
MIVRRRALFGSLLFFSLLLLPVATGCLLWYAASDPYSGDTSGGLCTASQKSCVGQCYSQKDPTVGCSGACTACNAPPNAQPGCSLDGGSYACALGSCNPQYGNCDGLSSNGCETHITKKTNCGGCGTNCADEFCEPQEDAGYACSATCEAGVNIVCGTECVNPTTDNANCGNCGISCDVANGTGTCTNSACVIACNTNYFLCDGGCGVATSTSCGTSCAACPVGKKCDTEIGSSSYGECTSVCPSGTCPSEIGSKCVADDTSPNCGACGVDCRPDGKQCCRGAGAGGGYSCSFPNGTGDSGGSSQPGQMCNP